VPLIGCENDCPHSIAVETEDLCDPEPLTCCECGGRFRVVKWTASEPAPVGGGEPVKVPLDHNLTRHNMDADSQQCR
jgi:hypothetical protein